jgi:hypothetical protein
MAGYIGSKASVVSSGAERKKTFTITGATTSLTGLNYTVGKVHVFQNGVRLVDGTDYTATNGTTITLTVAAQNGDNVVVISQAAFQVADALLTSGGTMTGDLTVQGAFTSQGIDDNADAVAMTIDSNENVFIGKTSAGSATGVELAASGQVAVTRDGAVPAFFRRNTSDGSLIDFNKDGTAVGSIGNDGVNLTINSSSTGHLQTVGTSRYYWDDAQFYPANTNSKNLGHPSYQFKDAYLSGGVYLGGTGSANKLEDYEEGTWTPKLGDNTTPISTVNIATYVKVGRMVTIQCDVTVQAYSGSSTNYLRGLPFTGIAGVGTGGGCVGWTTSTSQPAFHVTGASTDFYFVSFNTGNSALNISGERYIFSSTYETNA